MNLQRNIRYDPTTGMPRRHPDDIPVYPDDDGTFEDAYNNYVNEYLGLQEDENGEMVYYNHDTNEWEEL